MIAFSAAISVMAKNSEKVAIISDSYLTPNRLRNIVFKNNINIEPHRTSQNNTTLGVNNLAKGGLTFGRVLADEELLESWLENYPAVTLLHIGACDIVNKHIEVSQGPLSPGKTFCKILTDFIESLNRVAREKLKSEYQQWADIHRFIFVQLPDWQNFKSHRKNSLKAEDYRRIRRKVNKYLRNCLGRLYGLYKTLVIQPGTAGAKFKGVHLDDGSQKTYNEKVFNSVKRVLCKDCSPSTNWNTNRIIKEEFCVNTSCTKN